MNDLDQIPDVALETLMERYGVSREPALLARIFDETATDLLAVAAHLTSDIADAEDVLQATFLALAQGEARYEPGRPVRPWLAGVLTNKARRVFRERRRRIDPTRAAAGAPEPASPEACADGAERNGAVAEAIAGLPVLYRGVLEMVVDRGLAPHEIAEKLGRAPGTVRAQLHRGVAMLRKALPRGFAVGAALLAVEGRSLAAIRGEVERAAAKATAAASAASTVALLPVAGWMLAAIVVAGVGFWVFRAGGESEAAPRAVAEVAGVSSSDSASLAREATTEVPAVPFAEAPFSDAAQPQPTPGITSGSFELVENQGFDFASARVVAKDIADVWADSRGTLEGRDAGFLVFDRTGRFDRRIGGKSCSPDAYLRSIAGFEQPNGGFQRRLDPDLRTPAQCVAIVKLPGGRWAAVAFLNHRIPDKGESVFEYRYAYNESEPKFGGAATSVQRHDGIVYAPAAFETDPYRVQFDQRCRVLLDPIDREADAIAPRLAPLEGACVGAVASSSAAQAVSWFWWAFGASGYSFVKGTRLDAESKDCDPDVRMEDSRIRVNCVTDDRSRIWDLGPVPLAIARPSDALSLTHRDMPDAVEGHTYLIRTLDGDTDRWDLLEVLRVAPRRFMVFRWKPVELEAELDALDRIGAERLLDRGSIRIQMRGGAGGGNPNQAFLDGSNNQYVKERTDRPIEVGPPIDIHEEHVSYNEGGRVPRGRSWVITEIEYWATAAGDGNGHGEFKIVIGGKTLVRVKDKVQPTVGIWKGRIELKPGQEATSYVEIANSSQCDVTIRGELR